MDIGPPRPRIVQDMLFGIDGSGWHPAELRDGIGFRRSGPGRLSILRLPLPAGPGTAEAQLLLQGDEPIPAPAIFLNGHALPVVARRAGPCALLGFAWGEAAMPAAGLAEFWFHADRLDHVPAPGGGMRKVGFRLSSLSIEPARPGASAPRDAIALIAGRRFLDECLPVSTGRLRIAFRAIGEERAMNASLDGARLGPTPLPGLAIRLRTEADILRLDLSAPGRAGLGVVLRGDGPLVLPGALLARDALLLARLIAALPGAYAAWLDTAMEGAAPDAALLAGWHRELARLARAAESGLATALADGPDPFASDAAASFAWAAAG